MAPAHQKTADSFTGLNGRNELLQEFVNDLLTASDLSLSPESVELSAKDKVNFVGAEPNKALLSERLKSAQNLLNNTTFPEETLVEKTSNDQTAAEKISLKKSIAIPSEQKHQSISSEFNVHKRSTVKLKKNQGMIDNSIKPLAVIEPAPEQVVAPAILLSSENKIVKNKTVDESAPELADNLQYEISTDVDYQHPGILKNSGQPEQEMPATVPSKNMNTRTSRKTFSGPPSWGQKEFQVLTFSIGELKLAVPLIKSGGIHRLKAKPTPMAGHPPWYLGLIAHEPGNISLIDTARWIMPEKYEIAKAKGLDYQYLISLDDTRWGLACSGVNDALTLNEDKVKWSSKGSKRPWLAGMIVNQMCALLDVDRLIEMLEQQSDETT